MVEAKHERGPVARRILQLVQRLGQIRVFGGGIVELRGDAQPAALGLAEPHERHLDAKLVVKPELLFLNFPQGW